MARHNLNNAPCGALEGTAAVGRIAAAVTLLNTSLAAVTDNIEMFAAFGALGRIGTLDIDKITRELVDVFASLGALEATQTNGVRCRNGWEDGDCGGDNDGKGEEPHDPMTVAIMAT